MKEMLLGVSGGGGEGGPPVGVSFLGEVPASEFIRGDVLAQTVGMDSLRVDLRGANQYPNEPWLKFTLDGKTLFVAKKPIRHSISWRELDSLGCVFGERTVEINGLVYKVRLLTGMEPTVSTSEWNRLLGNIHDGIHGRETNTSPPGYWPLYSDDDLHLLDGSWRYGMYCWCKDRVSTYIAVYRGGNGIDWVKSAATSEMRSGRGWRPVLELVE